MDQIDDPGEVREFEGYYPHKGVTPKIIDTKVHVTPTQSRREQYMKKLNFVENRPMIFEKQPVISTTKAFY